MKSIPSFLQKVKNLIVVKTGFWFYSVHKLPVGTHLYYFLKFRTSNDFKVIFDVGSNIGQTIFEMRKHFPEAVIHSFEPFESTFNRLLSNTSSVRNIVYNNFALGDKLEKLSVKIIDEGSVSNSLNDQIGDSSADKEKGKIENVNCITLNHYLDRHTEIDVIDLLKIDTEGYDKKVLEGGEKYLSDGRVKFILTEVGFSNQNSKHIRLNHMIDYLESLNLLYIGNYFVDIRHILWGGHFGNALFIHKKYLKTLNDIVK